MTEINLFASNIPLKKLVLLLLLSPLISLSQGRKYSNAFLEIGIDARAMAMSNAVIASTNDISAAIRLD
jgi:general stress protein CsbA